MALTELEKDKIKVLRSSFTDAEWENLPSSDVYARERISFYGARELASALQVKVMLDTNSTNLDAAKVTNNNKITILQG